MIFILILNCFFFFWITRKKNYILFFSRLWFLKPLLFRKILIKLINLILFIFHYIIYFINLFIFIFWNKFFHFIYLINLKILNGDWGLGIGDWGLGIGDWAQSPIPNPQSPIPNPQSPIKYLNILKNLK